MKKKRTYKRIALTLSLCLILLWSILGTGASLAWFADTSPEVNNIFHFAEFDLKVSYRVAKDTYRELDGQTKVFDEQALYEPGYVQVVVLKIENEGTVPFNFNTAVNVTDYTPAINVFGQSFNLQDHLTFGVVSAETEAQLDAQIATRKQAMAHANMPLNNYSTDVAALDAKDEAYLAIIVCMPEEVGNEANYRGTDVPEVELGVIVSATQQAN